MPLSLPDSIPRSYFSHRSGDEHTQKHLGDIDDINAIRASRGLTPLANLYDIMRTGGIRLIRYEDPQDHHPTTPAAYCVTDRGLSDNSRQQVIDMWGDPTVKNGCSKLVRYALSKTCFPEQVAGDRYGRVPDGLIPFRYGRASRLVIPENPFTPALNIPMINLHHIVDARKLDNADNYFAMQPPDGITLLREVRDKKSSYREIIYRGKPVAQEDASSTNKRVAGLNWAIAKLEELEIS